MPPKIKVTRDEILEAAFSLVRENGIEKLNIRAVANALRCSTQPVMYNFATSESLKEAVYEKADAFHTQQIMAEDENCDDPMLGIGTAYVRFAAQEKYLFRFLFQSDHFSHQSITDLIENEAITPVLAVLAKTMNTDIENAKAYFYTRFLMVHGLASLLANNAMPYEEEKVMKLIENTFYGEVENHE